ncbi:MAG: class I SAM-dependent methyltransferase [Proteobacteria bacterium]|nr:class I SAM-dependent methyltransferase [Pseudomonadota bacterium]
MVEKFRDWNERYCSGDTPWDSGRPSRELERVLDEFSITPQSVAGRAIDIGCGTGSDAIYLAERGFDVTGVDLAPKAIEKAQVNAENAGVEASFRVADLLDYPNAEPFALVFDRGAYHCLRRVDLDAFLRTLQRITRPNSWYIALTGNANDPWDPPDGPPRVYAHELTAELAPLFDLVLLREFLWDDIELRGQVRPVWGWVAVHRRKSTD